MRKKEESNGVRVSNTSSSYGSPLVPLPPIFAQGSDLVWREIIINALRRGSY